MVVHYNLGDRWRPAALDDRTFVVGIGIVSNTGQFPPRSTITTVTPMAAGYRYMYYLGNNELLPDGELGSPLIFKYRFVQPEKTDG